ncbi:adhesion protein FadA [Leptotrichia sp. OH3620_COT-345]|uniref:adhesion protein FadA n=1 Tax=Leptotrichia sp. OH3620_COT-345 TaxID=2491048 RepID=UPI000F6515A0|nr:adhesion protein FadA [Leptotrichia sp. OH3620_COT-345]RRD38914.1 adhesion protein FadA [Leptotrichia sp. OH3620_COT-345]
MKKLGILFVLLSAISFADYQTINAKFSKLEGEYNQLVNMENQQYAKLRGNAETATQALQEKQALKAAIEEKMSKLEQTRNTKYFKGEYENLVKEYKNVVKALDAEIASLSKVVNNFDKVEELKGGN